MRIRRYPLLWILVAGAATLPLRAQLQPQQPDAVTVGGVSYYKVEGRLVAGPKNQPVAGVRMVISGMKGVPLASCVTDAEGTFAFYQLREGSYTITFIAPGGAEQSVSVDVIGGPIRGMLINTGDFASPRPRLAPAAAAVPAWALRAPSQAQKHYTNGLKALQRKDLKRSKESFLKAIQLYPGFAGAYAALGTAHFQSGDSKQAAAAYEKALEIDENLAGACLGLASLHHAQKRYAEAEALLLRALRLKPDDWRVYHALGETLLDAGHPGRAEASLLRARELHAELPRVHLLLINALAQQEKYPETLAAMDEYLNRFPKDPFAAQVARKREALKKHLHSSPPPP
jgi:Tfp pilus assembly protein PilF